MDNAPEIGEVYAWAHGGQIARVIVKGPPLPLMTEMKWSSDTLEPETFPGMAVQCQVEILPYRKMAFARVEDLSPVDG